MKVITNKSLKDLNTFKINLQALWYTEIESIHELTEIISSNEYQNKKKLILGGGSNILFTKDFDGLVIKNNLKGIEIIEQDQNYALIKSAAGESWHRLVQFALENNLAGIENLSLIPGTVGAAPIQNIGAYGVELKDTFEYLEALELSTLRNVIFTKDACKFAYRESIFKNEVKDRFVITNVVFKLSKKHELNTSYGSILDVLTQKKISEPTIRDVSEAVCEIRKSKLPDPAIIGNAGSFFKNPTINIDLYNSLKSQFPSIPCYILDESQVKIPAGWLIEQAGWKGKTFDNYGVHKNQALVIVNYGDASGDDIKRLSEMIQKSVFEKYQIILQTEVNFF